MADHDVIVIGAGVAGLTAGMTAAAHGLDTLVLDRIGVGGQVVNVERIENFPGFPEGVSGFELGPALQEQAEAAGAELRLEEVESLSREGETWLVRSAGGELSARAVIVATGSHLRALGVPGEEGLIGRGISHCASCDGPLFRGEHVVVVGGGDSAVQEVCVLAEHVERITLVHDRAELTAQPLLARRLEGLSNVERRPETTVTEIRGETVVTGVVLSDGSELAAGGVFVFVGLMPNSGLLDGIAERDGAGRLVADADMRLSVPSLYVAGDVRAGSPCWLASVSGDGTVAATTAARDLAS